MIGLGNIINTILVVVGGIIGLAFGRKISKSLQVSLMNIIGIAILFIGLTGALKYLLIIENGKIETQGGILLIISLAIGTIIGELINIEGKIMFLGDYIKKKIGREDDNLFVDGFVNTSLIICVGAMAIVGGIEDGLAKNPSILITKGILDFIIVMINSSIFGTGAIFAALPMFLYQGAIVLMSALSGNFIDIDLINNISMVGSVLIFCIGINLVWGNKIKVGNSLPAILVPIVFIFL